MQGNRLRFADYFFRAGIDPKCNLLKSKLTIVKEEEEEEREKEQQLKDGQDTESKKTSRPRNEHPLSYRYEADTIYRYPKEDYSEDDKYPPYTPMVFTCLRIHLINSISNYSTTNLLSSAFQKTFLLLAMRMASRQIRIIHS